MTETEWLACDAPKAMLEHLKQSASPRKLRLFSCACCRAVWYLLLDQRLRQAIEVAEGYADDLVDDRDRRQAERDARECAADQDDPPEAIAVGWAVVRTATPWWAAHTCALNTRRASRGRKTAAIQADLLRDIFGNPFRVVPRLSDTAREWNRGIVLRLAAESYEKRRFGELPVLADALEDAGCADEAILSHLRSARPHVRGCWVIDLILGKS